LAAVVDSVQRRRAYSIRIIERRELSGVAIEDNAMHRAIHHVESDCDAEVVYSEEFSFACARRRDGREVAIVIQETMNDVPRVRIEAGDLARVVDRRRDRADGVRIVNISGKLPGVDVLGICASLIEPVIQ
jgi:hypothetical protein